MNKKTKKLEKCFACQTDKFEYLENCDECKKEFCIECLGLYHGSERLFCQECFDKKSDEEKVVMLGKENKNYSDEELETKREKYREWVAKNPYPMDDGIEMKECEGCYCQMFYNSGYDFCSGCLGCEEMSCPWGCCDCYSDGTRGWKGSDGKIREGSCRGKEKQLSFTQKQRLHWEQMKQRTEDMIEKIKNEEDKEDMLTAKIIEDNQRWTQQEKERVLKNLTADELLKELDKQKETKTNLKDITWKRKTKIGAAK